MLHKELGKFLGFTLIIIVLGLLIMLVFVNVSNSMEQAKEDYKIRKELGYDGVRTVGFSSKVECANYTALEKYKQEQLKEGAD